MLNQSNLQYNRKNVPKTLHVKRKIYRRIGRELETDLACKIKVTCLLKGNKPETESAYKNEIYRITRKETALNTITYKFLFYFFSNLCYNVLYYL